MYTYQEAQTTAEVMIDFWLDNSEYDALEVYGANFYLNKIGNPYVDLLVKLDSGDSGLFEVDVAKKSAEMEI
ncbi:hypothetical protein [Adonisia turfae]|uniref:Uncharacterized protein n=1 Tax=Adonisia turfae CCMR0081 TaxID=2292702 RepID=A0A6M0RV81_9CYAN|nr:hypothetical protein [Adonisia turfae]NEZ60157.1 hypothetical protein [Adonisia turfae CCMR0081]